MGVELLGRRAYDQLSITELARSAGISKGLLYHYFPTKSDFVVAVLRRSREELELRMAPDQSLPPAQRMDASLAAFLAFVEERAAGYQAIARARSGEDEAIRAELAEGRRRRVATLVNFAAALAETDPAAIETPALETVIHGWLSYSEEVVVRWLSTHELRRDEVHRLLRQALLGALASTAAVDSSAPAARLAEAAERAAALPVAV